MPLLPFRGDAVKSAVATPGAWVDTTWKITANVAQALRHAGYVGVYRYVPLPRDASLGDISLSEAQTITDAGLQLGLVQHCRRPPVMLALHSGLQDATAATAAARAAGYPEGAHLFLDLEGVVGNESQVALYCDAWSAQVTGDGYGCGLYVGYSAVLGPDELYQLPRFDRYWSDAGPRVVATRGFCLRQHSPEVTVAGVSFDRDTMAPDDLGDLPKVCSAEPVS